MSPVICLVMVYLINFVLIMIGKFNSLECLEQGSGLIPNVEPDAFAVAPEFDCTEELRVEIDDTDETRPVRYTSDVRLILHRTWLPVLVLLLLLNLDKAGNLRPRFSRLWIKCLIMTFWRRFAPGMFRLLLRLLLGLKSCRLMLKNLNLRLKN